MRDVLLPAVWVSMGFKIGVNGVSVFKQYTPNTHSLNLGALGGELSETVWLFHYDDPFDSPTRIKKRRYRLKTCSCHKMALHTLKHQVTLKVIQDDSCSP